MEDPSASKTGPGASSKRRAVSGQAQVPWARLGNLMLGLWLQISSFVWPHTDGARLGTWLSGLLIGVVSVLSLSAPPMRWLNGVLALWLIAWTALSAASDALTYWNGIVCGLVVMVLSTIPSRSLATDYKE